jgi:hypothetical protein
LFTVEEQAKQAAGKCPALHRPIWNFAKYRWAAKGEGASQTYMEVIQDYINDRPKIFGIENIVT